VLNTTGQALETYGNTRGLTRALLSAVFRRIRYSTSPFLTKRRFFRIRYSV